MLKRIISGIFFLISTLSFSQSESKKDVVLNFIKNNPDKSAIKLVWNDSTLAEINGDRMMPLASTVKIIVAIEYAIQAAEGKIDADEKIAIVDLDKFFIPFTDGGAHPEWLKSVKGKIEDEKITIREIAKGIVGKEKFPTLKGKELVAELRKLSLKEYTETVNIVHEKLINEKNYKGVVGDLSMPVQKVWSDNLPASTTNEYAALMKKINSKTYFTEKTHEYLDEVMEYVMDNPANQSWLKHVGMKGGSSAWVLTMSVYGTDLKGNRMELAYFFNELDMGQNMKLQNSMNDFLLNIMRDENFREKIVEAFNE